MTSRLDAKGMSKHFYGVRAVESVDLDVRSGEIHGLIGPNGSGKTTMLNLLSGYYKADAGALEYSGRVISALSVQERAKLGIARTFQTPRLLGALTVLENVTLGAWNNVNPTFLKSMLRTPGLVASEQENIERSRDLIDAVGLGYASGRIAGTLDHSEQRFVEIARALAMRPQIVLMDEPAGGLTEDEIDQLATIVTTIRAANISVLIVEHHTEFVFEISDRVTTLDLGRVIAHGTATEVRNDPEVRRVYLGG